MRRVPVREGAPDPAGEGLGRSRGGWTSKIRLAVEGRGLPVAIVVSAGNVNDCTRFVQVMYAIGVARAVGRPRTRPVRVLADKGYSSRAIRGYLRGRGIAATIPERADQRANRLRRGRCGGRPYAFDAQAYRLRNGVERCFGRLKQFRGLATRYEKLGVHYRAMVVIASLMLWLDTPPISDRT